MGCKNLAYGVDSHDFRVVQGTFASLEKVVGSASDYYPFGMTIEERTWSTAQYRFGFNGKDFFSDWNRQDYGFRIYDPRKCRFESVDPLSGKYPNLSSYIFANNSPIMGIDIVGLEFVVPNKEQQEKVMGYFKQIFGTSDFYKFDKYGKLSFDKKAYDKFSQNHDISIEQIELVNSINTVLTSKRIIQTNIYQNQNVNLTKTLSGTNPVRNDFTGEVTNEPVSVEKSFPTLNIEGVFIVFNDNQLRLVDDRGYVLLNEPVANTGEFDRVFDETICNTNNKTKGSAAAVFIHEFLDHGLDYIGTGYTNEPPGSTKKDNVRFHNLALKAISQVSGVEHGERTGSEHAD